MQKQGRASLRRYEGSIAMTDDIFGDAERRMQKAVEILKHDITSIRTGRANASLVERITVDYYGTPTPINQVASISVAEARLLIIQPWDRKLRDREKKKEISEDELKRNAERLQKLTDRFIDEMDKVGKSKELEILEV